MLTVKELKQRKIFEIVGNRVCKKWQTSAIILEVSDSNLESGIYGPKSGVSRIVRES